MTGVFTAGVATGLLGTAIPANAVVGAAVADASYAFTANLRIGEGERTRACSGALIDSSWVLTASACFASDPVLGGEAKPGKPELKTVATLGRNDPAGTGGHTKTYTAALGQWRAEYMKRVTGDYDGDGRDDLGAMYHHAATGVVRMWTWTAKPDAAFNGALLGWESAPGSFPYERTKFVRPYSG